MQYVHSFVLILSLLVSAPYAYASNSCAGQLTTQHSLIPAAKLSRAEQLVRIKRAMLPDAPGSKTAELRMKIMTDGDVKNTDGKIDPADFVVDTADPSAPFYYPWGEVRIGLSGNRMLSFKSLAEYEMGGIKKVYTVKGYHGNGIAMTGPYHSSSHPWDGELFVLPNGELIGHGGVMMVAGKDHHPKMDENARRSRMWAKVERVKKADGSVEETWYYQDSIFKDRPSNSVDWVQPNHKHNYGATPLRDRNGVVVLNKDGNSILFNDLVDVQKDGKPWRTVIYASIMTPDMKGIIGEPVLIHDGIDQKTGKPYPATMRTFGGSLIEGFRPMLDAYYHSPGFVKLPNGKVILLEDAELSGTISPGDYVSTYGIGMLYKRPGQKLLSKYEMVENETGTDIQDMAQPFRDYFDSTWTGRFSGYYSSNINGWAGNLHLIPKANIPDGDVKSGWPKSEKEFNSRHRQVAWSPIKHVRNKKGQLMFVPNVPDQP